VSSGSVAPIDGSVANGFFVTNVVGYKLTHLVANKSGVYGVYAFNSKGVVPHFGTGRVSVGETVPHLGHITPAMRESFKHSPARHSPLK